MPWTEEPGRLQSMGSQRVAYDLVTKAPLPMFKRTQKTPLSSHSLQLLQSELKRWELLSLDIEYQ